MKFILWLFIGIFILNPYTIIGPLAYYCTLPFFAYSILKHKHDFDKDTILIVFAMIFISLIGVTSSFFHGIGQFEHLKVTVSILVYVIVGFGLYFSFNKQGLNFDDLVYISLMAIFFNSLIVVIEATFPTIRDIIEFFLAPSGNVDWKTVPRYRGIASGGGASLSVLIPVAVTFTLYLYEKNRINTSITFLLSAVLIISLIFIGRTGILLLPIVFALFIAFNFKKYFLKFLCLFFIATIVAIISFEHIKHYIIEQHGAPFYYYSFGFMLEGRAGFENIRTIGIIKEFLTVLPLTFPEVLIGYGFYGGSDFDPWTDTGYNRMFLSVGYLFGLIFYACFFLFSYKPMKQKPFLFSAIISILMIAEIKEPLLFTGYASRITFVLLAYSILEIKFSEKKLTNNIET